MFQTRWSYPEDDGGSPISSYELVNLGAEKISDLDKYEIAYKGTELGCTVSNLLPGKSYQLKLRAYNEIGPGEWSDIVEMTASAGPPDSPEAPKIVIKSYNCLVITWNEPSNNGAMITDYKLEWSLKKNDSFTQLYDGPLLQYELKKRIQPFTRYFFRVQALNINGSSSFSQLAKCVTPAAVPSVIQTMRTENVTSDSFSVFWKQPNCNGCPITSYNLDLNNNSTTAGTSPYIVVYNKQNDCEHKLEALSPNTVYR